MHVYCLLLPTQSGGGQSWPGHGTVQKLKNNADADGRPKRYGKWKLTTSLALAFVLLSAAICNVACFMCSMLNYYGVRLSLLFWSSSHAPGDSNSFFSLFKWQRESSRFIENVHAVGNSRVNTICSCSWPWPRRIVWHAQPTVRILEIVYASCSSNFAPHSLCCDMCENKLNFDCFFFARLLKNLRRVSLKDTFASPRRRSWWRTPGSLVTKVTIGLWTDSKLIRKQKVRRLVPFVSQLYLKVSHWRVCRARRRVKCAWHSASGMKNAVCTQSAADWENFSYWIVTNLCEQFPNACDSSKLLANREL